MYEALTLEILPASKSIPSPPPSTPQLFETIDKSFTPVSKTA